MAVYMAAARSDVGVRGYAATIWGALAMTDELDRIIESLVRYIPAGETLTIEISGDGARAWMIGDFGDGPDVVAEGDNTVAEEVFSLVDGARGYHELHPARWLSR